MVKISVLLLGQNTLKKILLYILLIMNFTLLKLKLDCIVYSIQGIKPLCMRYLLHIVLNSPIPSLEHKKYLQQHPETIVIYYIYIYYLNINSERNMLYWFGFI